VSKILLFNQYFTSKKQAPEQIYANLPINLIYLASYLKQKNMESKVYDLGMGFNEKGFLENNRIRCGLSDEKIVEIIEKERPEIIGLGCMYSRHYIDIISISNLIKKVDSAIQVVLGGNHATAFCDMVLKETSIDFVVLGEGEITFYELCENILSGKRDFRNIDGIVFKQNGQLFRSRQRELIKNLDSIECDYSLIDVNRYTSNAHVAPFLMRYPSLGIISSRGCPGRCIYCTVKIVWGKTWRGKSPKKVVDELELLNTKYGIKEFHFLDDSASVNKKRWNDICDEIINRRLDIKWNTPNGIAHWTLDKTILDKMKKAGCYRITFGIESGNEETRKFLGKPFSLIQAKEMIQYANKIGMWTICTNILGFPYETKDQINDTIEFAKKSGTDFAAFYLLAPHVTSDVYKYFKKEGLIDFDFIFNDNQFDEIKYEQMNQILDDRGTPTVNFTSEEIKKLQINAYKSFIIHRAISYLNPVRLLSKIRSVEDFKYACKLISAGVKILVKSFTKKNTKDLLYDYD